MNVLLNRQRHRPDGSADNFPNFGKNFLVLASRAFTKARVLVYFARLFVCRRNYGFRIVEQRNGIPYTRTIFARGVVDSTDIVPEFLNHTIFFDINFLLFSPFLLWRPVLFTFTGRLVVFQLIWILMRYCVLDILRFASGEKVHTT